MEYFLVFNWIILVLAIYGAYLNSKKDIKGFYLWTVTNLYLLSWNFLIGEYFQSVLFSVYLLITVNGIRNWKKQKKHS